jgi:hypothetical protein
MRRGTTASREFSIEEEGEAELTPPPFLSFKANSTNVFINRLHCEGSHGLSVGSLGEYPGVQDLVENIFVKVQLETSTRPLQCELTPPSFLPFRSPETTSQ